MKDSDISKYMSELSKKRKNPYMGFKDKEKAQAAGRLGGKKRWAKKATDVLPKDQILQDGETGEK